MLTMRGDGRRVKLAGGEDVDVGTMQRLGGGRHGGGGEGERGREEGVQLLLPESDCQAAAQGVEEVCPAFYFGLPLKVEKVERRTKKAAHLTKASEWVKKVTIWTAKRSVGGYETL